MIVDLGSTNNRPRQQQQIRICFKAEHARRRRSGRTSSSLAALAVNLEVLGEMVRPRELLLTQLARVRFDAGVRASVASELVGSREAPAAAGPGARERLLAGVSTQVRLEMRRLAVRFGAVRVHAEVNLLLDDDSGGKVDRRCVTKLRRRWGRFGRIAVHV